MKVEFFKHDIGDAELQEIAKVFQTRFLTTGAQTAEFEQRFAETTRAPHCLGVMSCTAALHLALLAEGIGPGDEVITTPMTFIASANVIEFTGAKPVFADVDPRTGCLDAAAAEKAITRKTRAIIAVHLYGHMCDMTAFTALAARRGLTVIQDCAHAIECTQQDKRPGEFPGYAAYSFYATKNMTCGEGGAITCGDSGKYDLLKKLRTHGMSANAADRYASKYQHWDMELLGQKCNMSNIQAAMLLPQFARLDARRERREAICRRYEAAFSVMPGVDFPRVMPGNQSARHLFTIWVDPARRDTVLTALQGRQVGVAVNYRAIHLLTYYREKYGFRRGMFPQAERIGDSTITLPLYPGLTDAEVDYVIDSVRQAVANP